MEAARKKAEKEEKEATEKARAREAEEKEKAKRNAALGTDGGKSGGKKKVVS